MIHNLSNNITTFFVKKQLIKNSDSIVFCYGMELLISTWIGFLTIILMSIILVDILFGIIYLIYIVPIRMYVGGYHAKSYMKCNIVFLLFFTIALVCYRNLEMVNYQILNYINLISSIFIFELAPLENKNKVIDDLKKRKYRNIDMSIYILGSIVGILIKDMFLINVLAIVLCNVTVLLLIGKGVEIYEKKSER